MKYFVTLTTAGELMYFHAEAYQEANFICGGFRYIELHTPCPNCRVKEVGELIGHEQELYRRLKNRDYETLNNR
jgi:hypothetical protein